MEITCDSGVYAIRNIETGTEYVGSSRQLTKRRYTHFWQLSRDRHANHRIQADYNKSSGNSSFEFRVLEYVSVDQMKHREQEHIDTGNYAYNIYTNAFGPGGISEDHLEQLRQRMTGKQCRYIGEFTVPWGVFQSTYQASAAIDNLMSQAVVWTHCRDNEKVISRHAYSASRYLQENFSTDIIGRDTWKDLGFSFAETANSQN